MTMTRQKAYELDSKVNNPFYVDEDGDGSIYVFGTESGFAYSEHGSYRDAETEADKMNEVVNNL